MNDYLQGWGRVGAADPLTGQEVLARIIGASPGGADLARLHSDEARMRHGDHSAALMREIQNLHAKIDHTHGVASAAHHKPHHHPDHEMDVVIGFDTVNVVAPNATIVVVGIPVVPVHIKQMIFPSSLAGSAALQEIRVGMKPFNASASFFSASAFSEQARVVMPMDLGIVAAGTQIQVTLLSLAGANQRYVFNMHGKNMDNACHPDTSWPPTLHQGHHPGHPGHPGGYGGHPGGYGGHPGGYGGHPGGYGRPW